MEYGETLNLPKTEFPMRGNLPQREPEFLETWQEMNIYKKVAEKNQGREKFILHDGPPYANGDIHLGHVLNKVLKDMVVKYKSMSGYDAPFVPGWDTHGLPIELRAIKDMGIDRNNMDKATLREKCTEYALKFVDIQREQFKRLGVRGDWDDPYITLMPKYEAIQIQAFGDMAKKGYIYKGKKPVYWCADCETALAEAEVEYEDHKSASIYVKFKVRDGKGIIPEDANFVIWTTTPWTIPANLAICLHPDYVYVMAEINGDKLVVAKELLNNLISDIGAEKADIIAEFKGSDLELITTKHPLLDRDSIVILGDHVTLDAGTGCVHTAPGHGVEDFEVGMRYGLEILSPVDSTGHFTAEAGDQFAGIDLEKGNKVVCQALEDCGALLKFQMISHQYPHCWRCKKPIIFRATEQWFASVEGFRKQALEEIDKVKWIPAWGRDRIYNMVRDRSDWCISRQRTWGVPIPIFYCEDCGKEIINDDTISFIVNLVREHGSNIWFSWPVEKLMPEGTVCPECGGTHFRKETDIMDVWFDSGVSHLAVLEQWPDLTWPADLYLEGSDQHRGWFNSSLSVSVALRNQAPYRTVLTHGFLVDEKGTKQSKSIGNTVNPLKVIDQMGADVLRLWVSSADYRNDLAASPSILKQVSESYRKIRNTLRFLLGNIYDFDVQKDSVSKEQLSEFDFWAMNRLDHLIEKVLKAYENYEFHLVYHAIHKFCVVDMSAFYLDSVKDCLYTELPNDPKRRAVQTVLYHTLDALMRLLVPVLAFTSEEVYNYLPKNETSPESVQLLDMPKLDSSYFDESFEEKWDILLSLKDLVSKELENARQSKTIGHSLDAWVELYPDQDSYQVLSSLEADLAKLFIVSQVTLHKPGETSTESTGGNENLLISVKPAKGDKCERCWIYSETVGDDKDYPTLCSRCATVMHNK